MRFHFTDTKRHRRVARDLAREMRRAGIDVGRTAAADVAARLFGYADAHELASCAGRRPGSAWDEDEAPGVVAARRAQQVDVLLGAGFGGRAAGAALDAIRPTARGGPGPVAARTVTAPGDEALDVGPLLDEWDRTGRDHASWFGGLVRRAYEGGFDFLRVGPWEHGISVYALSSTGMADLADIGDDPGLGSWLAGLPDPCPIDIGDGRTVRVASVPLDHAHRHFLGRDFETGWLVRLLDNLRPPVPSLERIGFPAPFEAALLDRPGLHVVHAPDPGMVPRLPEILKGIADGRGIPFECGPGRDGRNIRDGGGETPAMPFDGSPSRLVLIENDGSPHRDPHPYDVVLPLVSAGAAVVLLDRRARPFDLVRMLLYRASAETVRRSYRSGAVLSFAPGGGLDVRFQPYAG